jgi:small-conductance mechanosensitive channel
LLLSTLLSAVHWLTYESSTSAFLNKFSNFLAFFSLCMGAVAVIKLAQIIVYLYLFFKNISQGIPRLIVNLLTVVFSVSVISFIASEIFAVQVTAMLATSAVFSLVLGLALQDTLGNLFSGVAMQMGQPYKIGDWIEVHVSDSKKWIGQVQEITWRATFLSSFSDEWIMIPNKTMAQSQIIINSSNHKHLRHSQLFRIRFQSDMDKAKSVILASMGEITDILKDPAPRVLNIETAESWITVKVFYSIRDFELKYRVADQVISSVVFNLKKNGIELAGNRLSLES